MSHFMREKFGDGVPIDIYEKTAIGGRMATVELAGDEYESGGSIIHPANEYMVNFTQMLGESIVNERETTCIYDVMRWFLSLLIVAQLQFSGLFITGLKKADDVKGERMGIFDGSHMVFDGSSNAVIMMLQLFYHYGWDIYRVNSYVKDLLRDFNRYRV